MPGTTQPPLLVTCLLDSKSQDYFQKLRNLYFPPDRNIVPAHLSLFHNLPSNDQTQVQKDLESVCNRQYIDLAVTSPKLMGNGVMFECQSAELNHLHACLARRFEPWLIPQDRQKFKPHIVVQNKVASQKSRETRAEISATFEPFTAQIIGLCLWTYLDGPWRLEKEFSFETIC